MYLENIIFNEMQDKYKNFHRKSNNFGILKPVFYNYFSRIEVPVPNIVSLIEELDDIMNTMQISIIGKDLIKYFLNLLEDHGRESGTVPVDQYIADTMLSVFDSEKFRKHVDFFADNLQSFFVLKSFDDLIKLLDNEFEKYVDNATYYGDSHPNDIFFFNSFYLDETEKRVARTLCFIPVIVLYDTIGLFLADISEDFK